MGKRRVLGREFKVEAARLGLERGVKVSQASKDPGIHENVLRKWMHDILEKGPRLLRERPNVELTRPPTDPVSAFVTAGGADLDQILCHEELQAVGKDNTVALEGVRMQIMKRPGRPTSAGLEVIVRRHLDGTHSSWRGPRPAEVLLAPIQYAALDLRDLCPALESRRVRPCRYEARCGSPRHWRSLH